MEINTNSTNTTTSVPTPQTYQIVLGCVTFFLVLPFVLIPMKRYPLGSTGAVLVGAFLMVVTTVIDQSVVYQVIGDVNNLKTIFLLWGMMIISSYFERERLIDLLLNKLFPSGLSFHWWLLRLSIVDSILAALFTNDVACVILTPLVLNTWIEQKREKHELNTLLLALATQANIGKLDINKLNKLLNIYLGSTLTIFGNPQMALMASKSNAFVDPNSRLELKTCVEYLWLPTFIVWLLNFFFLLLHHRLNQRRSSNTAPEETTSEISIVEQGLPTISAATSTAKLPRFTERFRLRQLRKTSEETPSILSRRSPVMINRSVSVASFPSLEEQFEENEDAFLPSESRPFKIILFILLIVVIALLFASNDKAYFDIGMYFLFLLS
jgi:hypothetical protein